MPSAQQPRSVKSGDQRQAEKNPAPALKLPPLPVRAWNVLHEGLADNSYLKRAKAVHALGLLKDNAEGEAAARAALKDEKADVRVAAAGALGSMHAIHSRAELQAALDDDDPSVVLAAANSLLLLQDTGSAYDIYYGVLTGSTRANKGFIKQQIDDQLKILHDRKKLAQLGIEQGIGFIPFAGFGFGYDAVKQVMKSDASPVRAAAAKKLAHDPSATTARALLTATHDKNWMVRAAALEAISERGDKALTDKLFLSLDDEREEVRFTAAACIAHLSGLPGKRGGKSASTGN